jgi:predicted nucleic acid-binding protein
VATDAFIDTNVLLYLVGADAAKAAEAQDIVGSGGVVSVQVLNEFIHVARRKQALGWPGIGEYLSTFRRMLRVEALTLDGQSRAVEIASTHRLGILDANILAAAELAGCSTVWSEDMQDGFRLGRALVVRNPFA